MLFDIARLGLVSRYSRDYWRAVFVECVSEIAVYELNLLLYCSFIIVNGSQFVANLDRNARYTWRML